MTRFLANRLTPSPQTLVVTTDTERWAIILGALRQHFLNPVNCNIESLFAPNRIKVSTPHQCLETLKGRQIFQQILLDGPSTALFYEPKILSTFAMLAGLSSLTDAHLVLALVAPDPEFIDKFIGNILPFEFGLPRHLACWLVGEGNTQIRYLRFSHAALNHLSKSKQCFKPNIIFPVTKSRASAHFKPLIEVTKP